MIPSKNNMNVSLNILYVFNTEIKNSNIMRNESLINYFRKLQNYVETKFKIFAEKNIYSIWCKLNE